MDVIVRRKSFSGPVELRSASGSTDNEGSFRATIARIAGADGKRVIDKEGDAYLGPQTFPRGKAVVVSAYGHKSWEGALPVGYGVVGANQHTAWVSGEFFTNTTPGRDTWLTVKALAAKGLGEWSYGYDIIDASTNLTEVRSLAPGARRVINSQDIFEVSPVLVGAGVGTATEDIKAEEIEQLKELAADIAMWSAYGTLLETQGTLDAVDTYAKSDASLEALVDHLRARGIQI